MEIISIYSSDTLHPTPYTPHPNTPLPHYPTSHHPNTLTLTRSINMKYKQKLSQFFHNLANKLENSKQPLKSIPSTPNLRQLLGKDSRRCF
ncbi:MAG UNVERIFIED_CONTAM: hypothetical protein LVR29_16335 [Microcystis novacekii LVE1205-3]